MVSGGSCVLHILNNAPKTQMVTNKIQKIVKPPTRRLNNQSQKKEVYGADYTENAQKLEGTRHYFPFFTDDICAAVPA